MGNTLVEHSLPQQTGATVRCQLFRVPLVEHCAHIRSSSHLERQGLPLRASNMQRNRQRPLEILAARSPSTLLQTLILDQVAGEQVRSGARGPQQSHSLTSSAQQCHRGHRSLHSKCRHAQASKPFVNLRAPSLQLINNLYHSFSCLDHTTSTPSPRSTSSTARSKDAYLTSLHHENPYIDSTP